MRDESCGERGYGLACPDQGVVNTFVIFLSRVIGDFVDRVVFKTERDHGPAFWITTIVAQMVLGILAT